MTNHQKTIEEIRAVAESIFHEGFEEGMSLESKYTELLNTMEKILSIIKRNEGEE